jgi:hypothetical protein
MARALGAAIAAILSIPLAAMAQEDQPPPVDDDLAGYVPPEKAPPRQPDDDDSSLDIGPIDEEEPVREDDEAGTGIDVLNVQERDAPPVDVVEGGRIVVHPASSAPPAPPPLNKVADSPSARAATGARGPLGPMINPGADFLHGYYRGVVPGQNHIPPRARRLKNTRVNFVTWPGFEPFSTGSRIFIQSTRPLTYSRIAEPHRIVLELAKTRIHLRNNYNPLVTEHFDTPVAEAYLRQRRGRTVLVVEMKVDVEPRIHQVSEHGYHFLFLEFPSGHYPIPTEVRRRYHSSERLAPASGER